MTSPKEKLHCQKCGSTLLVRAIDGRGVREPNVDEVKRWKEWRRKHGEGCVETEKTEIEVTL